MFCCGFRYKDKSLDQQLASSSENRRELVQVSRKTPQNKFLLFLLALGFQANFTKEMYQAV